MSNVPHLGIFKMPWTYFQFFNENPFGQGLRHIPYWHLLRSSKYPTFSCCSWRCFRISSGAKDLESMEINSWIQRIDGFPNCWENLFQSLVWNFKFSVKNRFGRNIISGNSQSSRHWPQATHTNSSLCIYNLIVSRHVVLKWKNTALLVCHFRHYRSPLVSIPQTKPASAAQHSLPRTGLFAASSRGDDNPTPWRGHSDPKEDFPLLQPPNC